MAVVGTRIYPNRIPQNAAKPFIGYRRISTTNAHEMAGATGLTRPTFEFTVVASSYSTAKNASNLLRIHLDGYQGLMQDVGVRSITKVSENDTHIAPTDGGDVGLHVVESDYQVWLTESIPTF